MKNKIVKIGMNMMHAIMLSCDDATFLISKAQYNSLNLRERIQLKLHLMGCKFCRLFENQSQALTDKINDVNLHNVKFKLSEKAKRKIRKSIDNQSDKK